jgi:hypothetical protein
MSTLARIAILLGVVAGAGPGEYTDDGTGDPDGDGVTDAAEAELGTDPADADSDDDGMSDGDEVRFGFDPLDPDSDGYEGGWPMQDATTKDEVADAGGAGEQFPRLRLLDQFGDEVDLYDYARQGMQVVVEVGAAWCGPCREGAAFLAGDSDASELAAQMDTDDPETLAAQLEEGKRRIDDGEILWVSLMSEDQNGDPPTRETVKAWDEAFSNERIAVLLDVDQKGERFVSDRERRFPAALRLDEDMMVLEASMGLPFIAELGAE